MKVFIVTEFNVAYSHKFRHVCAGPSYWLDKRFELFQKFTVPSVKQQVRLPDRWIVMIHPRTPPKIERAIQNQAPYIITLRVHDYIFNELSRIKVKTFLERESEDQRRVVIWLCNDDAINKWYCKQAYNVGKNTKGSLVLDITKWLRITEDFSFYEYIDMTPRYKVHASQRSITPAIISDDLVLLLREASHSRLGDFVPQLQKSNLFSLQTVHDCNVFTKILNPKPMTDHVRLIIKTAFGI